MRCASVGCWGALVLGLSCCGGHSDSDAVDWPNGGAAGGTDRVPAGGEGGVVPSAGGDTVRAGGSGGEGKTNQGGGDGGTGARDVSLGGGDSTVAGAGDSWSVLGSGFATATRRPRTVARLTHGPIQRTAANAAALARRVSATRDCAKRRYLARHSRQRLRVWRWIQVGSTWFCAKGRLEN